MKDEWNILQVLRYSRHDWLNVVQLIKGNLALKKFDRIEEIIQDVVIHTQNESKLSNLNMNKFATNILIFNWENHHFQLDFEVIGENRNLNDYDEVMTEWFLQLVTIVNNNCEKYENNHLLLTIEIINEQLPRFTFDFHGKLISESPILNFIDKNNYVDTKITVVEANRGEKGFYITFTLK